MNFFLTSFLSLPLTSSIALERLSNPVKSLASGMLQDSSCDILSRRLSFFLKTWRALSSSYEGFLPKGNEGKARSSLAKELKERVAHSGNTVFV
jgi:hypothetical protein